MEWMELLSVFGDRLTIWRSRLAEAEADAQSGKGPKPAAATGESGLPPPPPQGPQYDTSTHAGRVLTKFQHVCRNHLLHARCKNPNCPRDHNPLSKNDVNELWNAAKELLPKEFRGGNEEASASDHRNRNAENSLCKFLRSPAGCYYGNKCQWKHNNSPEELARVQRIRAARANSFPSGQAAGGVHAQMWDPDSPNPWATWTADPSGPAW